MSSQTLTRRRLLAVTFLGVCCAAPLMAQSSEGAATPQQTTPAAPAQEVLIDVRTPQEFSQGHIEGALNIEYQNILAELPALVPDKNTPIALYCRSGRRSGIARNTLQQAGYTRVRNLGGLEEARQTLQSEAGKTPPSP